MIIINYCNRDAFFFLFSVKKPILVFQQMNKFSEFSIKRKKPEKKQRKEKRKAFFLSMNTP